MCFLLNFGKSITKEHVILNKYVNNLLLKIGVKSPEIREKFNNLSCQPKEKILH